MDEIRVLADYDCFPTWLRSSPDGYSNDDPASFGLSEALVEALLAWADEYDATLDRDDPAASGFKTTADRDAFVARGRELAERVAREVADRYAVTYFDENARRDEPITAD